MGNFLGPKSSQIRSPFHYSHLYAGGSEEDLNWSLVQLWSDSHDCAFHSQTIWASSPHNSQLPAWAQVEEHSVFFPSCFKTRCLEHCRTLPWRGGGKRITQRVTGEKRTAASLFLLKTEEENPPNHVTKHSTKASSAEWMFSHKNWKSTDTACMQSHFPSD